MVIPLCTSFVCAAVALYSLPAALNRWDIPGKHGVAWAWVAGCSIFGQCASVTVWLALGSPT